MRDADVFEGAYSRFATARPQVDGRKAGDDVSAGPSSPARTLRDKRRSRLLPRLALMMPRGRAQLPDAAE